MPKLSNEAKIYLRTLLEYAEGFEGFLERLETALPDDEECTRTNTASSEIWSLLEE